MKLFGIGNSHIQCIRIAAATFRNVLSAERIEIETVVMNEPRFKPLREPVGKDGIDGFGLCAAIRDEIKKSEGCDLIFSCIGGNDHNVFGLVEHPQPFDFVLEERPELPLCLGRECIPTQIVSAALE